MVCVLMPEAEWANSASSQRFGLALPLARLPRFLFAGFKGDPAFLEERFGKHFDVDALRDNVTRLVFYQLDAVPYW